MKVDLSHETIEKITGERLRSQVSDDINFYDKNFIEDLNENDEVSSFEVGFMSGYLEA
ncbi:MAG: hypothetical protein Q8Q42_02490 [Nanoarchaeota archaeon]|nr:hypothetical protein [Nanoarchaeota archaeon]